MATTDVIINIDSELKDRAQHVFEMLGLDMSTAIAMLLRKAIYQQEMRFEAFAKKIVAMVRSDALKVKLAFLMILTNLLQILRSICNGIFAGYTCRAVAF